MNMHKLADTTLDRLTDIAAVGGIVYIATTTPDAATQLVVGGLVTLGLGKHYARRMGTPRDER